MPKNQPHLLEHENRLYAAGMVHVAGVDEVGRGCLAGPVCAAAVILPPGIKLPEVDDSKKLSPKKREQLFPQIVDLAISWSVAFVEAEEIDRINIHHASLRAMQLAVEGLKKSPEIILIDGRFPIASKIRQLPIIRGDGLSQSIAAASILAKVSRDRWMQQLRSSYPHFEFERHKGYGTARHLHLIRQHGPTPLHRRTFMSFLSSLPAPRSFQPL